MKNKSTTVTSNTGRSDNKSGHEGHVLTDQSRAELSPQPCIVLLMDDIKFNQ